MHTKMQGLQCIHKVHAKHDFCHKTLFYDNVHVAKNIRNNLLNSQKFVFPALCFSIKNIVVASSQAVYISWRDFKDVHEDAKLKVNLRKAPKLTYEVLHLGHNKQNVNLALAIFHDTTIAAIKSYFPSRQDVTGVLSAINVWWKIVNSKQEFYPNDIANVQSNVMYYLTIYNR